MKPFTVQNTPEGEPFFTLASQGKRLECNRENTSVYTHSMINEEYDHVFVQAEEFEGEELEFAGQSLGAFMFRNLWRREGYDFDLIVSVLHAYDFTHIHKYDVSETDQEMFWKGELKDLDNPPRE